MAEDGATSRDRDGVIQPGATTNLLSRFTRPGRHVVRAAAKIVAAVVLLELAAIAAWWSYSAWRLGRIELTDDGPPLTVQVLDESGEEPIGPPVELVTRATLSLPAGDYRLLVTGTGRLSRTYRMAVNRGETLAHALNLDTGRLLGEEPGLEPRFTAPARTRPIPYAPTTTAVELTPGKADLVEWTPGSIVRRDGATGEPFWDALSVPDPRARRSDLHPWLLWLASHHQTARLVQPAPDLNGDGTGDLVWTFAGETALLAVSGKDGSVLWTYVPDLDGPGGAYPAGPPSPGPANPTVRSGLVYGEPVVADLDGDGRPDLIAAIKFDERPDEIARRSPGMTAEEISDVSSQSRRVVMAISGRSGTRLWSHAVDPAFRTDAEYLRATIVPGRKTTTVAIADGATWQGLDAATGRRRSGPIDLGSKPERFLRYADLDGDGEPEVIAMDAGTPGRKLKAFSVATGRPIWTATFDHRYDGPFGEPLDDGWPMIADLDGDGRSEIVVPDSGALDARNGYHGVRALDGATGRPWWTRPMRPDTGADDWLASMFAAPDLDHDGVRDILTVSFRMFNPISYQQRLVKPHHIYVDALSGKDGRPLWWWRAEVTEYTPYLRAPRLWGRGPDGWPLLAVTIGEMDPRVSTFVRPDSLPSLYVVHMLEASTGRVVQTLAGFTETSVADLDGDGLPDLWGEYLGDLHAFRGEGPEAWRALEKFDPARPIRGEFRPGADLDGDGIGDALTTSLPAPGETSGQAAGSRTALARSGRDGRLIWKSALDVRRSWFDRDGGESYDLTSFPPPAGDLDGDGTPDVLVKEDGMTMPLQSLRRPATLPLFLLSGRTGRPLWTAGPLPLGFEAHGDSAIHWAIPRVVEPGAPPDVLVGHDSPFLAAGPTPLSRGSPVQERLARVSGRTGNIIWDVPLVKGAHPPGDTSSPPLGFHDIDGDGVPELILQDLGASAAGRVNELKVVSLRDGRLLWSRPFEAEARKLHRVHVLESDGGGPPNVVALFEDFDGSDFTVVVRAFDGRDGKELWTWNGGKELWTRNGGLQHNGTRPDSWMTKARPDGSTRSRVCVFFRESGGKLRLVDLDARGREVLRRDVPGSDSAPDRHRDVTARVVDLDGDGREEVIFGRSDQLWLSPRVADLDGDGREEVIFGHSDRLWAWGCDGKELWSWPDDAGWLEAIVPPTSGRTPVLMLPTGLALDGKTGVPRWKAHRESERPIRAPVLLDPGGPERLPLMITHPQGTTVCRSAMPATSAGTLAPPRGTATPPGLARDDPRWTRPLPWTDPILRLADLRGFLVVIGLALVNAVLPIGLLRLAARRRPWTIRLLMALPVAVALPLWVFQTVAPVIPTQIGATQVSTRLVFVLGTLAGLPIVIYAVSIVANLFRRRWKALAWLAGLTAIGSAVIAAAWLWSDSRTMPAIEHYGRSGWPLVLVPGAYAVGVLLVVGWILKRPYRWLTRRRPEGGMP